MWQKPCRTFNPWCLCIKTRCLLFLWGLLHLPVPLVINVCTCGAHVEYEVHVQFNTLMTWLNGRHFADGISRPILLKEHFVFGSIFTAIWSYGFNNIISSIASNNGLVRITRRAIICCSNGIFYRRKYASLGFDGLANSLIVVWIVS